MRKSVLAIIPARGGSKGILRKNIAPLAGRPLVDWTISAAQDSATIHQVVVSSDCDTILRVSRESGAQAIRRPPELATDSAPSEPVAAHILETLENRFHWQPDIIVLLQPTTPLRTAEDIDAAVRELERPEVDAVISVYEPRHTPFKAFAANGDGFLRGVVSDEAPFMRRQDLPTAYFPNGAIYAIRTAEFLKSGHFLAERTIPYVMPEERSIDIDTPADLQRCEDWLCRQSVERRERGSQPPAWAEALG